MLIDYPTSDYPPYVKIIIDALINTREQSKSQGSLHCTKISNENVALRLENSRLKDILCSKEEQLNSYSCPTASPSSQEISSVHSSSWFWSKFSHCSVAKVLFIKQTFPAPCRFFSFIRPLSFKRGPRGVVLSPLLFNIFTLNLLHTLAEQRVTCSMYGDDIKIFKVVQKVLRTLSFNRP